MDQSVKIIKKNKFDRKTMKKTLLEADKTVTEIGKYIPDYLKNEPEKEAEQSGEECNGIKKYGSEVTESDAESVEEESGAESIGGESGNESVQEEDDKNEDRKKPKAAKLEKLSKLKTIEELQQKLEEIKGRRKDYAMKLLQKAIKNKLKKKKKAEIRKQKKLERNMKSVTKPEEPQKQSTKPALAIDDKIIYSKFDFAFSDSKSKNNNSQKDPKRALEKIEKTRAKLKELENSGRNAKASALKMKQSWISALQKAEGVKVKDDVDLIKKSIKKKEHKKNKSKKMWEERNKQVELRKEEQQKKRRDNIADRNKKKKQKKIKRAIKKGRIIQ